MAGSAHVIEFFAIKINFITTTLYVYICILLPASHGENFERLLFQVVLNLV